MARTPVGLNLIGQPELSELVMRALALKGDLPQLCDPVYGLSLQADDWTLPEYQYLRRMGRWQAGEGTAAVAAQFAYWVLGPRTLGRNLCVVERLLINNFSGTPFTFYVYLSQNAAVPGNGTIALPTDDRLNLGDLTSRGNFSIGVGNIAADAHPSGSAIITIPATTAFMLDAPYVLSGQRFGGVATQLVVQHSQVNVQFHCTAWWRERSIQDTEL